MGFNAPLMESSEDVLFFSHCPSVVALIRSSDPRTKHRFQLLSEVLRLVILGILKQMLCLLQSPEKCSRFSVQVHCESSQFASLCMDLNALSVTKEPRGPQIKR